jgi:hypothetical protein
LVRAAEHQAVLHPELNTLGLVAIRDFLKNRVLFLRLVAQNNIADCVNVILVTVVASIDPELLENLDMENVDADSVDDCTEWSVMEFLDSTQERDATVKVEFVKAEVLANVTFAMSEKDPDLRFMKAVADYYSLHLNLRLDFINGKPKNSQACGIGDQTGHAQDSDREQTINGQAGPQE